MSLADSETSGCLPDRDQPGTAPPAANLPAPGESDPTCEGSANGEAGADVSLALPAPPVSGLITLFRPAPLVSALTELRLVSQIFRGFRAIPASLSQPVIRKRIEVALASPEVLSALGDCWRRHDHQTPEQIDRLPTTPDPSDLQPLVEDLGVDAVRWALLFCGRRDLEPFLDHPPPAPAASEPATGGVEGVSSPDHPGAPASPPETGLSLAGKEREQDHGIPVGGKQEGPGRKELLEARQARDRSDREAASLRKQLAEARQALAEEKRRVGLLEDQVASSERRIDRLQRKLEESEHRGRQLQKTLNQQGKPRKDLEIPRPAPPADPDPPPGAVAEQVIARLMERGQFDAVIAYAREAWELDAADERAEGWLIRALREAGYAEDLAELYYQKATREQERGRTTEAVEALCESIRVAPDGEKAGWRMERLLQVADPVARQQVELVAALYGDLKRENATAAGQFEGLARRLRRKLWRALPTAAAEESRRVSVPWPAIPGGVLTPSLLAGEIAAGNLSLVQEFRRWAARAHGEAREMAGQLITGAEAALPGARRALTGPTRRILVDGSNVAWTGQPREAGARLENLRRVRESLLREGYFPVEIIVDASLPWQIDNPERLRQWDARGEIRVADAGIEADDLLVSEARRWGCPILTNDRMRERHRGIRKIPYTLDLHSLTLGEET